MRLGGKAKVQELLEIPEMLMDILEQNACEKAMRTRFTFEHEDNIKIKVNEINTRIK